MTEYTKQGSKITIQKVGLSGRQNIFMPVFELCYSKQQGYDLLQTLIYDPSPTLLPDLKQIIRETFHFPIIPFFDMRQFLVLFLLLLAGFVAGTTIIVPCDLDQAALESFLRCLDGTGIDYRLYVSSNGEIVVISAQQRWLDTNGVDSQLI